MQELATYISEVITGLATMIAEFKKLPGVQKYVTDIFPAYLRNTPAGALLELIKGFAPKTTPGMGGYPSSALGGTFVDPNDAARKKAEADAAKRAKELAALQKKTLNTQKQQIALTKAGKTLDIERIGITAALRNQVSETDRLSLNLQLALLDKNEAAASKLSGQLDAAVKRQNDLAALLLATPEAANPYRNWVIPADVQAWTAASLGVSVSSLGTTPVPISSAYTDAQMELAMAVNAGQVAEAKLIAVEVYLDGDLVGNAIRDSSINQSLSGSFNSVNRAGRFDQLAE